jgi:hypothetical protein
MKLTLEQNLLDIKSMESNQNIHNVMLESLKATHALKLNVDEFENVADKVKDNVENLKEVHSVIGDYNSDALNDEELEKELNQLQVAENKKQNQIQQEIEEERKVQLQEKSSLYRLFPSVNNRNVAEENENKKIDEKENFINENSFQEILEELNKR